MAACVYGLDGNHKHLPEMKMFAGLDHAPVFAASVDHSFCGMLVSTPIPPGVAKGLTAEAVFECWQARYADEPFIKPIAPSDTGQHLRSGRYLDLGA